MAGWLDVGGLGFAENGAAWTGASGLEEHEDDDGSGPRCSGRAVWDSRQSSWSSSARLSLAWSALRLRYTNSTRSETKGEESSGKLLAISLAGGLAFRSCSKAFNCPSSLSVSLRTL